MGWIELTERGAQWRTFVNTSMNFGSNKDSEFFDQPSNYKIFKKNSSLHRELI
jgi:hypothetical protein